MSDIPAEVTKCVDAFSPGDIITREGVDQIIASLAVPVQRELDAINGRLETSTFHWSQYIDSTQHDFIRNGDIASQDEALVTAGVQALFDAAMAYAIASSNRQIVVFCQGDFAVRDELTSESFAQNRWTLNNGDDWYLTGIARFHAKNWIAATAPRASGLYAEQGIAAHVPKAMLRWEQSQKRETGPVCHTWKFIGEGDIATDPIGILLRNVNTTEIKAKVESCAQGGWHVCDINNGGGGVGLSGESSRCGANITGAGGSGFLPEDVRVAVTPGSGTSALSLVNLDGSAYTGEFQLLPEHVGREIVVTEIGPDNRHFSANIASVQSTTTATLDRQCSFSCTRNIMSFTFLPVDTVAGSASITLPPNMTLDLTGRYVGIIKGGSWVHPEVDTPYVRVISHNLTTGAVVLARAMRETRNDTAIFTGPSVYVGKDEDQVLSDGVTPRTGHNNDLVVSMRIENGDRHYSTIPMFGQYILATQFVGTKWHGVPADYDNFAGNFTTLLLDNCKLIQIVGCQADWGMWSGTYGKFVFTGARTAVVMVAQHIGDFETLDKGAVFYTDPQAPGRANCLVNLVAAQMNAPDFPSADQALVRNGPNGLLEHVVGDGFGRSMRKPLSIPKVVNSLEVSSDSPKMVLVDENEDKAFRIFANGSEVIVDFSQNNDGVFDTTAFKWSVTEGFNVGAGKVLFTPTLLIGGTEITANGGAYSARSAHYYRAFGKAHVKVDIELSAKGTGTGAVTIALPSAIEPTEYNDYFGCGWASGFSGLSGHRPFGGTVAGPTDAIALRKPGAGGGGFVAITDAQITDSTRVVLSGWIEI